MKPEPQLPALLVDYARLYDEAYFQAYRADVDSEPYRRRLSMYAQEFKRIGRYVQAGAVLDVGCGLGDFLQLFDPVRWQRYGIEVSPYAREIAQSRGIQMELPAVPAEFFNLIVFRGTIQHLDEPLGMIKNCIRWLRPGGYLVFLATPNIGGVVYRLFQELPALDPKYNFMLVSDRILRQILENLGMVVIGFEFPYLGTPYAEPARDLWRFLLRCLGVPGRFAFWGNMLECYAHKPGAAD